MTNEEWNKINNSHSSAIVAPAGHGKTEMITEIINRSSGKHLILTHTNAGVDAIQKRMAKKKISSNRFKVETIASFCIRWCNAYFNTSQIDLSLSPSDRKYYNQFYTGAKILFQNEWAGNILKLTYSRVIVDEYQDCTLKHHAVIKELEKYLQVIVLGDPLQGIFSFKDPLVDWSNLGYPIIKVKTYPWRWEKTNKVLGEYLNILKNQLWPTLSGKKCSISISNNPNISIINPHNFDIYKLLPELQNFSSVIYVTKWEKQQLEFCKRWGGLFQMDEKLDCNELFEYASFFDDNTGCKLALSALYFAHECATKVSTELKSYFENLQKDRCNFSRITKHKNIGSKIKLLCTTSNLNSLYELLSCFKDLPDFKIYRKELYYEMLRSIKYALEHNVSISDGANHIRRDLHLQKRYTQFKFLSTRTLLSKGLEFDCVIIDMSDSDMKNRLNAKEFYVAMTRAMKKIYIISDTLQLSF